MHILIAGATGAAGRALIPRLIATGYAVTGTTRTEAKTGELRALGANAQIMDGLDAASVKAAIDATQPDVIVHQMTALTGIDMKNIDKAFHLTNRLRTEGTEHILAAANGRLLIAQSFAGWPYERRGGPVKTESDPLDPTPPKGIRETHAAIRRLERLVTEAGGIVLRYGGFYGPRTRVGPGGGQLGKGPKRRVPPGRHRGGPLAFPPTPGFPARRPAATSWRWSTSAGSRWSATARASGPSCTPRISRPARWRRSSTAARARSTTSSTTSPRRRGNGSRTWLSRSAPSRRARCRPGWRRSSPAPPRWP